MLIDFISPIVASFQESCNLRLLHFPLLATLSAMNNQPHNQPEKRRSVVRDFFSELRRQYLRLLAQLKRSLRGQFVGKVLSEVGEALTEPESEEPEEEIETPKRPARPTAPERSGLSLEELKEKFEQKRKQREERRWRREEERQRLLEEGLDPDDFEDEEFDDDLDDDFDFDFEDDDSESAQPDSEATEKQEKDEPEPLRPNYDEYELPPPKLLDEVQQTEYDATEEVEQNKQTIQETVDSFGIDAEVIDATRGPRVTLYKVNPARGVKVEAINSICNNLAMELSAMSLRILAPVPGQDYVGLEVPNREAELVYFRSLLEGKLWQNTRASIPLLLGKNISGSDVILDLTKAPHLLIAGATGSGKSVCLNGLLLSMLYRFTPDELQMILVDPKVVEFSVYNTLPHLITPVVTEAPKVVLVLRWVVLEMERRYKLMAKVGVRNLEAFNQRPADPEPIYDDSEEVIPQKLPMIVVVIDELADIMMTARGDVENLLARIAQMSRAVGIHTIIATQRPSVNVITGIIKANYPTRIAFQVSSNVDSRTIIDGKGAESLLGRGDMLFKPPGASRLQRIQGAMVSDGEIERLVEFVSSQGEQFFDENVLKSGADAESPVVEIGESLSDEDEALVQQAMEIIIRDRRASTSYIQRRLRIGYNRAATLIEILEQRGIIGPQTGGAPREIFVDPYDEAVEGE